MSEFQRPEIIKHNGEEYYDAKELKKLDPVYFYGTSGGIRKIIKKKKIDVGVYHYATFAKRKGWSSDCQENPCKKACLLLLKSWVESNIPMMMEDDCVNEEGGYEYPQAPNLLILDDEEKFRDSDGRVAEIETRGERTSKGVYFSAKDVSVVFGMPELVNTILRKGTSYLIDIHYKTFIHVDLDRNQAKPIKQLFLTYKGMLKVLFNSRTGRADKFVDWATDTLFTHQMGSWEEKEELSSKLLGCDVKDVRTALKPYSAKLSSVYCFSLGTGESLRDSMELPEDVTKDDDIVIKFGFTNDLDRRSNEHVKEYEKIKGVKVRLMEYVYIDPAFLSEAEVELKQFFTAIETPVKYKKYKELISINPKHLKEIQKKYKSVGVGYQGNCSHLIGKLEKLEYQLQLKDKDIELREAEIRNRDTIIRHKDIEIELKDEIIRLVKMNK